MPDVDQTPPRQAEPVATVVWPALIVRGVRGSQGTFYAGQRITRWDTADHTEDHISDDEIVRLTAIGAITTT